MPSNYRENYKLAKIANVISSLSRSVAVR